MFADDDRKQLPSILPVGHTVPLWQIMSKFVKQDMTRVSLPVLLNEPLNAL